MSQVCQSVCAVQNPCAANAICRAQFHRPLCVCPVGWAGNPQVRCYQRKLCDNNLRKLNNLQYVCNGNKIHVCFIVAECVQDSDCPTDRQCISEKCKLFVGMMHKFVVAEPSSLTNLGLF